ncbi:ATP-dependent sacrificial sulfur transferase LarE [Maridesulfovibrio bastinii]|uniref:ATP-dependent sacrificial sulfur transferase LarE n=1 Tax=Maridesulfovibrio bastinii TaxID=47157 RepID=UPI000482EA92|nr:ATP-dependent sacrificial sulfur transferase LarE [Maridesulfovibrio bastinii]
MNTDNILENKYKKLSELLSGMGNAVLAFSGGVDSSLLLYAAAKSIKESLLVVTFKTPYSPQSEIKAALKLVESFGVRHLVIETDLPDFLQNNPPERCYLCKKYLFGKLLEIAADNSISHVIDGSNVDDLGDYRPGRKAIKELGIESPLLAAGFSKQDIRDVSRIKGLDTWDTPAGACLLTRIPHGNFVEESELLKIDKGEQLIRSIGFPAVRLRSHGRLARIEVPSEEVAGLCSALLESSLSPEIKALGYDHVTVDIDGYRMGSLNKIDKKYS